MGRGGYQQPPPRQGVSGPGRYSKRTDGDQPIREPDIDDPGMEYGDRSKARDTQRVSPLRRGAGGGSPASAGGRPPERMTGQPISGDSLPSWLLDAPSTRPLEPVTAGLDVGPGAGADSLQSRTPAPDLREQALEYLSIYFKTPSATEMLQGIRKQRIPQAAPMAEAPGLAPDLGAEPEVEM